MKKRIGSYPRVCIEGGGHGVVSQAGAVLLVETARKAGLDQAISTALAPWRRPRAVHDPGRILLDVALAVALGGDCLPDVGMLRAEPAVFGPVASDPTVSRLIDTLAANGLKALSAVRTARAEARERVWNVAKTAAPDVGGQVIVDLDGVLVLAHSKKQDATATWKKTLGHHPLMGFVDHGSGGNGEPVAGLLRPGNAGSNTAADHITTAQLALAQLPKKYRRGRQTLIRTDSGGGTHEFVAWLAQRGRRLSYSVGMTITDAIHQAVLKVPPAAWTPAVEPGSEIRDGAWVAELTGDVLKGWPNGMRLIVRKERPHPGAQLRITDADGLRLTAFATNTTGIPIAALELRHRQRARAEDRIRNARATGLRNLPLHDTAQNQIWLEIVQIALDLLAWMPMLALTGKTRRWEPRRRHLRFARHWPWTDVITDALARLEALPNPG
ncbi:IS1380 family transposase, partial [Streptomyces parvus]|uniref:IS1380 family transposase n=1 Tax=Streptomyces parvus TaxID=66428 RepID=UPI0033B16CF7